MTDLRDPWLTEREAAKELRVSTYVVRAERESGKLKFARIRSRVFYPMSEIDAYKRACLCQSDSGEAPSAAGGTSHGPNVDARAALRRAREIINKPRGSARLSS